MALNTVCVLAGVTYDESFGTSIGRNDIEPSPLGLPVAPPTVFNSAFYSPTPFDPAKTQSFKVYVKGNRLARVGSLTSTIYDLDAGTVMVIDHEKRRYAVMAVAAMQRWLERGRGPGAATYITISGTGRTMKIGDQKASEYLLTVRTRSDTQSEVLAHAVYWNVEKLPSDELAAFQKRCLDKYGRQYPAVCSLTESKGFGILSRNDAGLDGYPVLKIIEWRMPVPAPFDTDASPAEIYPADSPGFGNQSAAITHTRVRQPSSFARIVRTETQISNFVEGPIDDANFAIPKGYKPQKNVFGH